jgi:thiol:disulfide interchange protein DsbD
MAEHQVSAKKLSRSARSVIGTPGRRCGLFLAVLCWAILLATRSASLAMVPPQVVTIESVRSSSPLRTGDAGVLWLTARIAPGWHINSNSPSDQYYIPTRVKLQTPPALVVGDVVYPPAQKVSLAFAPGQSLSVFTGEVEFRIPIRAGAGPGLAAGLLFNVRIDYQACNDRECLRPGWVSRSFDLASIGQEKSSLNAGSSAGITPKPEFPDAARGATAAGTRNPRIQSEGRTLRAGWLKSVDPGPGSSVANLFLRRGYVLGFLAVLLAGVALNLTPCVYPLIGVTIAYFGYEGGGPRKVIILALLYVFGIIVTFSGVGVTAALTGSLFGAALQNPYVLASIAAMLLVLAAGSFGLFSLRAPQWLLRNAGTARPGYAGALAMGLGMGVVAAPCIGPFVLGLLLMVQQSASVTFGLALFATLAAGLGLPYVALAIAAGSLRQMPRSGAWLAWIEQLFGFVLVGLALYFVDPLIPHRLVTRTLPYYAAGAGIYLGFLSRAGRNWQPFLVFRSVVGLIAVAGLIAVLIHARTARTGLTFRPFDPALLQTAREERKPVVVDFSADWCVPCREMEATTFVNPAVVRQAHNVVRLKANLTSANPGNTQLMRQFKVEGVPTTIFIDGSGKVRVNRAGYIGARDFLDYLQQIQ